MDLKALHNITYGVYVVTSKANGRINGQAANTVFQISSKPATLAVSINKQNFTHGLIKESGLFAVSVLPEETPISLIGQFGFKSGRDVDKFEGMKYETTENGIPYLTEDDYMTYIEARVIQEVDANTHTIFIGEVIDAKILRDGKPMTYAYYHQVKRGTTPPTAPTYIKDERRVDMGDIYECTVCGYRYDPAKGDPEHNIPPGTSFEDLPDDWVCPVCGATKDQFEKVE